MLFQPIKVPNCQTFIAFTNWSKTVNAEVSSSSEIWGCCKLPVPVSPRCSPGGATTGEASKSSDNFIYKTAHFKVDCVNYFKKQFC